MDAACIFRVKVRMRGRHEAEEVAGILHANGTIEIGGRLKDLKPFLSYWIGDVIEFLPAAESEPVQI